MNSNGLYRKKLQPEGTWSCFSYDEEIQFRITELFPLPFLTMSRKLKIQDLRLIKEMKSPGNKYEYYYANLEERLSYLTLLDDPFSSYFYL